MFIFSKDDTCSCFQIQNRSIASPFLLSIYQIVLSYPRSKPLYPGSAFRSRNGRNQKRFQGDAFFSGKKKERILLCVNLVNNVKEIAISARIRPTINSVTASQHKQKPSRVPVCTSICFPAFAALNVFQLFFFRKNHDDKECCKHDRLPRPLPSAVLILYNTVPECTSSRNSQGSCYHNQR